MYVKNTYMNVCMFINLCILNYNEIGDYKKKRKGEVVIERSKTEEITAQKRERMLIHDIINVIT